MIKITIQLELTGSYSIHAAKIRRKKQKKKGKGSKKRKRGRKKQLRRNNKLINKEIGVTKIDGLAGEALPLLKTCGDEILSLKFQRRKLALICKQLVLQNS